MLFAISLSQRKTLMWGLAIFCEVLRKPVLARGIHFYHWSSCSLCPTQRHIWLTRNPNSLTLKSILPMPAIFGQRLLLSGKDSAKKIIERKPKPRVEKAPADRKMKPKVEEMTKEKLTKSKRKSRVDETPKEKITESKIEPKAGEPPRLKNIDSKMKLTVEKTPKENITKSKTRPKASKEKNEKIKVKSKVEKALKKKSEENMIKPKVEDVSNGKMINSEIKSKIEEASVKKSTHSMTKPRIEKASEKKNMASKIEKKSKVKKTPKEKITDRKVKLKVEETPKEKITDRKVKLKVEETPNEKILKSKINSKVVQYPMKKTTKSKVKPTVREISEEKTTAREIKFKAEETPKVKITKRKIKPEIEVIPIKKIAKSNIRPQVVVTPKSKIKVQVAVIPKKKILTSKIKEKTTAGEIKFKNEETPKVKITKRKIKPQVEVIPIKKIAKSNIKPQVQVTPNKKTPKSKIKAQVAVIPKKKILTSKIKEKTTAREIKFKNEETPKVKITKSNIKPQVEVIPIKKIAKRNIKPQVEVTPKSKIKAQVAAIPKKQILTSKIKEKTTGGEIKFKNEETPKVKITKSNIKPQVEVTPNKKTPKSKIRAQVAVIPKKQIPTSKIKPLVEVTSKRKINKRKKQPKVLETSKEKNTKSKIKFKVEETPKEKANLNVHEQVRQVFQDYLYYTRGLSFADANHISLNAPSFVRKLSSVFLPQAHNHTTSAVQRHLLYNPINEFEPFFESIGIQPCDIHDLLPYHGLHLSENQTLLATVSTFTNIGFPRHQLGKLYVERPHLFGASSGEMQKKLQFYENIGVSKASLVSVLTWCPTLLDDDVYKQFVKVANGLNGFHLEKNRICCLTEENIDVQSSIMEKLMLLVGIGCSWDEISQLYHTKREIFINSSERAFYSTIEMFSSLGLRREDIGSFVLQCPEILQSIGLDKKETLHRILHCVHDLHGCKPNKILEGTVPTVCEKEISILSREHHKSTKLEGGVGDKASLEKNLIKLLEEEDFNHRKNAPVPLEIKIDENLVKPIPRHRIVFILKLGLAESPEQVAKFDSKLRTTSDKLQKRVNYLLGLGFPFQVVCKMVRGCPNIVLLNSQTLQKKVNFLCSSSSNPMKELEGFPNYFCFHLERRIMPRVKMYSWLKAGNMLKTEWSLWKIVATRDTIFLKQYASCHPQEGKALM